MSSDADIPDFPLVDRSDRDSLSGLDARGERRRRRRVVHILLRIVLGLVVVVLAAVAAVPAILSSDAARRTVLARINRDVPQSVVEIRGWSWRWFGPCRIEGISVRDRAQTASLRIESITASKGLFAWIGWRQRFGTITVNQPVFSSMSRSEQATAVATTAVPAAPNPTANEPDSTRRSIPYRLNPYGEIVVQGGRAEAFPPTGPAVRITEARAGAVFEGLDGPLAFTAQCSLPQMQGRSASTNSAVTAAGRFTSLRTLLLDPAALGFEAKVSVPPVDLAALSAFLPPSERRPQIQKGQADARFTVRRGPETTLSVDGQLNARDVKLAGGALTTDALTCDRLLLAASVQCRGGGVAVREFRLESPFGTAQASGTFGTAVAAGGEGALAAKGMIDVAALAAQLPATMRLRPGVRVRRGGLRFDTEAASRPVGTHVFAMFRSDGIDAVRDGRVLALNQPFTFGVNADLSSAGAPEHATLTLKSAFAQVTIDGGPTNGTARGEADLGGLYAALESVFAMEEGKRASGWMALEGGWAGTPEGLAATGKLTAGKLSLTGWATRPIELASGSVSGSATVPARGAGSELRLTRVVANASTPFASLQLTADEAVPGQGTLRGFSASLDGQWTPFVACLGGSAPPLGETMAVAMAGDLDADALRFRQFRAAVGPFEVNGKGVLSALQAERQLSMDGTFLLDLDALQTVLKKQQLDGVTLSGRSERPFRLAMPLGGGRRYLLASARGEGGVLVERLAGLGLHGEKTVVDVTIRDGQLALRSTATVNDGQMQLAPSIDLLAEPPLLTLPRNTRVLTEARITEELLELQLARVHPILRGCSVSSGWMTVDMADCAIPLVSNATQRMTWTSKMTFRDTHLNAAGLLAQAADALRIKQKEVVITNQTVMVSCRAGRLYPQALALTLGGHPLRVEGSVGLDGTLDYAVDVPLNEELVGVEAYRYLRGQTLRIPIVGTAAHPRLDVRALEAEVKRLVAGVAANTAVDTLRGQLKNGAKKLDRGAIEDAIKRLRR